MDIRLIFWDIQSTTKEKENYIMKEKIDLSLNRSLEELIASYWEAEAEGIESSDFYVLEDYLSNFGAI